MHKLFGFIYILLAVGFFTSLNAQGVLGQWKTIDDKTGNAKSILNVYMQGEKLYAKVEKILEKGREDATCVECKGSLKDKPILGMQIINGLVRKSKNEYAGGTILDPENGQKYRCRIWLNEDNPNELRVRGYLAFFYRTQTWIRITD